MEVVGLVFQQEESELIVFLIAPIPAEGFFPTNVEFFFFFKK